MPPSSGSNSSRRVTTDPDEHSSLLLQNIRNDKANIIISHPRELKSSKIKQFAYAV
jgi:hypothetical protein